MTQPGPPDRPKTYTQNARKFRRKNLMLAQMGTPMQCPVSAERRKNQFVYVRGSLASRPQGGKNAHCRSIGVQKPQKIYLRPSAPRS